MMSTNGDLPMAVSSNQFVQLIAAIQASQERFDNKFATCVSLHINIWYKHTCVTFKTYILLRKNSASEKGETTEIYS